MSAGAAPTLALVDAIYDGVAERQRWRRFLERLSEALDGAACAWLVQRSRTPGEESIVLTHGFEHDPALGDVNVWQPPLRRAPIGRALILERPAEAEVKSSAFYRRILEPRGISWGPALRVLIARDERRVCSQLAAVPLEGRRKFGAADVALFQELTPHLIRAREMHLALVRKSATAEGLFAAIDRLKLAIFLLDENSRFVFANRSACELSRIANGRDIQPGERQFVRRWVQASRRSSELKRVDRRVGGALMVRHFADGRPLQVLVVPLDAQSADLIPGLRVATAVFVGDPKSVLGRPDQVLEDLYGLSPAQARLALALAADLSLEEAAEQLGISVGTARGRLKRVFAKTGTRRQASLVRLLHTASGQLRESPG